MQQQIDGGGGRRVGAARWWRWQHSGSWFTAAFHYIKTFLNNKTSVSRGEDIHNSRQTRQSTVFDHAWCLCAETWWRRRWCLLKHHSSTYSFCNQTDRQTQTFCCCFKDRLSLFNAQSENRQKYSELCHWGTKDLILQMVAVLVHITWYHLYVFYEWVSQCDLWNHPM